MSSRAYTSALRTALVAAICLGGAFQAGKMLYMDYTRPVGEGDGPAVASVEWQSSQVRRKPPSSYLWGGVQTDDPLYRRDSVRTGADSAARIKLKSGTTLELGENSLIVLEDSEDLSFNTLKGSLVVRKPSGATRVTVDAEGKKTATQLQVSLVEPEPGTSFAVAPGQRFQVRLKWKRWGDSPGKSRLQVASNSSFSRVVKDLAPEGESTEMVLDLPAGEYYWRILEAGAGAKAAGDTSRFSVNELSPPKLLSPADNEVSEIAGDEGSVQLRWVPTEGGHAVRLELTAADDPGFGHARTVEVDGRTGFATVDDLKEGQYLWRTQASLGDLKVPGAPRHFALKKSLHLKVALASPEDGAALEWRPRLRFAWSTTVLDKLAYRLRIRKAGENTKYLLEQELGAPAFAWDDPVDGPLEWQVSALAEGKDVGDSEWRPFSVRRGDPLALLEPADQAVIRYWGETPDTRLSWNPDRAVEKDGLRYHLEVSPQFRFERDVKTADLQKHEIQFSTLGLPPGRYFWRVTVLDESGKVVKASETRSFDQGVHPLLPAPVAVTPREGEKFEQLDQERKTVLHWEKVADARGYRVMLSRADTADKSRQDFQAEGDSLELPALKQEGEYYWSVSAVDPLGRVGEASPPRRFSISWGGQLAAPLVKAPEPGEVDFKWDAVENAVRYEVEVGRIDETPKSVPVDGRSWEGSEEKHSPGLYRVRVRAADRFGRGGAWSAPQAMVVFASPPQPVSPTDGAKVQTYFDGSDVTLQWVPRKGADAYLVDVFSGGLLVKSARVEGTSLHVDQLKTADYDWKIRTLIEGSVDAGPSKRWQSPDEGKYSFTVHRRNLEPPAALDPEGDVQVTTSSRQLFQWEPVQGAVAYLLKIRRMDDRGKDAFVRQILDRSPASAGLTESTGGDGGVETVVLGTHVELDLPHDGSYLWEVRGLASIQADDRAKYAGPGSEAKFEYEQEIMGGVQGSGYLALSTMLAPYTYSMISPESGFSGQAASTAVTMRVSAERIMTSKLGLGVAYETTFFQLSGASFTRGQAELVGKYKIELPGGQYPWVIQPNIGPQARQYFQLTPGGGGITNNRSFWTLGASVGIDVRKQLSKRFSLGARASLFVPLGLSGLQGDHHLTGTASFRNLSLGLQGVYWLGGSWGLAAGAYHDDRSISFNSTVPGAVDEQVYTDGSYFYGSVIYKF